MLTSSPATAQIAADRVAARRRAAEGARLGRLLRPRARRRDRGAP